MKVESSVFMASGTVLNMQPGFLNWINGPICNALQLAPPSLAVSIRIHVTGKKAPVERHTVHDAVTEVIDDLHNDAGSVSQEGTERGDFLASEFIKIENGRPDLTQMLGEEVQSATGRLSVTGELSTLQRTRVDFDTCICAACCSPKMAETVRRALRFPVSSLRNVLHGGPSVSLFVETYGYA